MMGKFDPDCLHCDDDGTVWGGESTRRATPRKPCRDCEAAHRIAALEAENARLLDDRRALRELCGHAHDALICVGVRPWGMMRELLANLQQEAELADERETQ